MMILRIKLNNLFFAFADGQIQWFIKRRMHKLHSGGTSRAIRCMSVISVAMTELPADLKCQFGESLPLTRLSIQRINCKMCNKCESFAAFIAHISVS